MPGPGRSYDPSASRASGGPQDIPGCSGRHGPHLALRAAPLVVGPRRESTAWSTVGYCTEHIQGSVPSLTLKLGGDERSRISRRSPGLPPLGITPNLLTCTHRTSLSESGPAILPAASSIAKHSSTGVGLWTADIILIDVKNLVWQSY